MEIIYSGNSSFILKHKKVKVLVEPDKIKVESEGETIEVSGPGEYEIKEVSINGIKLAQETIYTFNIEDLKIGYLSNLSEGEVEGVDILLISVGKGDLMDAQKALEIINKIEPAMVIPMHETAEALVKLSGLTPRREKKVMVSKLTLPLEMELVLLDRYDR